MKTKIRASKISIESVKPDREVWIHVAVQQVIYDNNSNIVNIIPNWDRFSIPLRKILREKYDFSFRKESSVYGYEIISVITNVVVKWLKDRYNVEEDEKGNLWLL